MVTFLEAGNKEKLLAFYEANRFSQFDIRQTKSDTDEQHELVQLLDSSGRAKLPTFAKKISFAKLHGFCRKV